MIVLELFLEFALLSFVAFGGATALLPEMQLSGDPEAAGIAEAILRPAGIGAN